MRSRVLHPPPPAAAPAAPRPRAARCWRAWRSLRRSRPARGPLPPRAPPTSSPPAPRAPWQRRRRACCSCGARCVAAAGARRCPAYARHRVPHTPAHAFTLAHACTNALRLPCPPRPQLEGEVRRELEAERLLLEKEARESSVRARGAQWTADCPAARGGLPCRMRRAAMLHAVGCPAACHAADCPVCMPHPRRAAPAACARLRMRACKHPAPLRHPLRRASCARRLLA